MKKQDTLEKINDWFIKADTERIALKDECYNKTREFIKTFGEEREDSFVVTFNEEDEPCITDHSDCDPIVRNICRIEVETKYDSIILYYGDFTYDYVKYSDLTLTDRLYLLGELVYLFKE